MYIAIMQKQFFPLKFAIMTFRFPTIISAIAINNDNIIIVINPRRACAARVTVVESVCRCVRYPKFHLSSHKRLYYRNCLSLHIFLTRLKRLYSPHKFTIDVIYKYTVTHND